MSKLTINRTFVNDLNPLEAVECETRTALITDDQGTVIFQQACSAPRSWSQLAINVVASKYFYGGQGTPTRENSVCGLVKRVCHTIAARGQAEGYFNTSDDADIFRAQLEWLCINQYGAFNSPVWFNVGLAEGGVTADACNWVYDPETEDCFQPENAYQYPQASACFIQSVRDDMEDIMRLAASEALLFKFGSGTGTDLSTIRSKREKLSGGGTPSGPLSFMRVYDQIAGVVKSGGKTRRAAKMQSLKVSHPDILEFITCKHKEEKKAQCLIAAGYEANFNGEAYSSVSFQNANLSVRVSDQFMHLVDDKGMWTTTWVTDPNEPGPTYPAEPLLREMAECAWKCGDPGIQFDDTINDWNTVPESDRINATNPCSEFSFIDDTSCNLASLNLMKFRTEDGAFDHVRFVEACRIFIIAQEILVSMSSYPTTKIAENSFKFRPLGLGYSNLGALLMASGITYGSDEAQNSCKYITALMHGAANLASAELAETMGPFEAYQKNATSFKKVMQKHRDELSNIQGLDDGRQAHLEDIWTKVVEAEGFRNAQVTVLAPTGTISFMMDCDTTGIEPDIALVKYKQLAGGGSLKIVNQSVDLALQYMDYSSEDRLAILEYIQKHDTIEGAPHLNPLDIDVFDCAFKAQKGTRSIPWRDHLYMMAAAQPFLSGAISKTVNMPNDCTVDDIMDAYRLAWVMGLKAVAVYRDGSKLSQPLSTKSEGGDGAKVSTARPKRERLPETRESLTHKFEVGGHEGYLTVGLYPDGRPGEMFITVSKEGSTVAGLMDSFATAVSMSLQHGVPLEILVDKFSHTRFEPNGITKNDEIRFAKSLVDYIFRWMGIRFASKESQVQASVTDKPFSHFQRDAPSCEGCGSITVRSGNCYLCHTCGTSLGCS